MQLTRAKKDFKLKVISIAAGKRIRQRLAIMGIYPQTKIEKISSKRKWGPITIKVKGSKIIIGHGLAKKIMVCSLDR